MRVIRSVTFVSMIASVAWMTACGGNGGTDPQDACANVSCDPPAASCDGDVAVTYSGPGACDPNDGSCSYSSVEVRTSCTDQGQICSDGACVDPCTQVTCDQPPAATCDGNTLLTYAAAGTCDASTLECSYPETQTDCTQQSQICSDGACVDPGQCYDKTCETPPGPA